MRQTFAIVKRKDCLAKDIYRLRILEPYCAENAKPGQFVNIRCGQMTEPLLRRPISICDADREKGVIDIVFAVRGRGTALLADLRVGEELDLLGPLGNGFDMNPAYRRVAVVGGGIGIFPLLFLLRESPAEEKTAFLGCTTAGNMVLTDEFAACSCLCLTTNDGSLGEKGLVTSQLAQDINRFDCVYACGPRPMLRATAEIAEKAGVPCQLSMEERMGCGVGACLVCACKTRDDKGVEDYKHVCSDGPVFDSRRIVW